MPRRPLDFYETPPSYVEPLLRLIGPLTNQHVYECCVGQGNIARYLLGAGAQLLANDINPACPAQLHADATTELAWPRASKLEARFDWVITNPPFNLELPILERALDRSRNVAFLSRLSFLEPTIERGPFLVAHEPTDIIVLPRYSFRLNDKGKRQTDNVTCAWLVWREGHTGTTHFSTQREFTGELPAFADYDDLLIAGTVWHASR